MDLRPKPTDLMDPDQANALGALDWSRSIRILIQRTVKRENGPGFGSTRPSVCIKGLGTGSHSFSQAFLFLPPLLSSSLRRSSSNPNPNFQNPTQKCVIHGSKVLSSCSSHKSVAGIHMHQLQRCRSWNFFRRFSNGFGSVLGSNLFWMILLADSLIYNGGYSL